MIKYWVKNRLLLDVLITIILVVFSTFTFLLPMAKDMGESRLLITLYENDKLDFDVPSPSYDQIKQLEEESFIESVFPYYYTEASFGVNDKNRSTNLFLSDSFSKLEQTMYCESRLIKKAEEDYNNPIYVDYEFICDTGLNLGDVVYLYLGDTIIEFTIQAIYETNTYYDNGAVIVKWEGLQKEVISQMSQRLVYSGAYIYANNYQQCKDYLLTEYKPFGRLKSVSDFVTMEAYQIHYNTFMSSDYSNEITDFNSDLDSKIQKSILKEKASIHNVIFMIIVASTTLIFYNIAMWIRKSEKNYFLKREMVGESNVFLYYLMSCIIQTFVISTGFSISLYLSIKTLKFYIPYEMITAKKLIFIIFYFCIFIILIIQNTVLRKINSEKQ